MRGLVALLLLLACLALGQPARPREPPPEVLGYWLHADGHATEFIRGPDGRIHAR